MSGSLQLGFSDYEQVYAKKKTRRQIFLDEMEATIPWDDFHWPRPFARCKFRGPIALIRERTGVNDGLSFARRM